MVKRRKIKLGMLEMSVGVRVVGSMFADTRWQCLYNYLRPAAE